MTRRHRPHLLTPSAPGLEFRTNRRGRLPVLLCALDIFESRLFHAPPSILSVPAAEAERPEKRWLRWPCLALWQTILDEAASSPLFFWLQLRGGSSGTGKISEREEEGTQKALRGKQPRVFESFLASVSTDVVVGSPVPTPVKAARQAKPPPRR